MLICQCTYRPYMMPSIFFLSFLLNFKRVSATWIELIATKFKENYTNQLEHIDTRAYLRRFFSFSSSSVRGSFSLAGPAHLGHFSTIFLKFSFVFVSLTIFFVFFQKMLALFKNNPEIQKIFTFLNFVHKIQKKSFKKMSMSFKIA